VLKAREDTGELRQQKEGLTKGEGKSINKEGTVNKKAVQIN